MLSGCGFTEAVNFFCNLPACFFQEQVNETKAVSENSIWLRAACFSSGRRPAPSTIQPISPASPSLPDEKPLALGPTTDFSDKA